MPLHSVIVLVLVLCLGWKSNTQEGSLSDVTIYADPGRVIPQGNFISIVCSTSGDYDMVRLEKEGSTFMEKKTEPHGKEHRFRIGPVNETITGCYHCIFKKNNEWSQRSNDLQLKVIKDNVTQDPAPGPTMTSDASWLKTYSIHILIVVSVIFLLCLSLFLFCFLSHRQKKQGLLNNKSQHQRSQERLNLATNGLEMTSDIVTDDRLSEDRQTETCTPVAGDLQEVTYAQLDHDSLTQRTVKDVTPQNRVIMAESSTYAAIMRC